MHHAYLQEALARQFHLPPTVTVQQLSKVFASYIDAKQWYVASNPAIIKLPDNLKPVFECEFLYEEDLFQAWHLEGSVKISNWGSQTVRQELSTSGTILSDAQVCTPSESLANWLVRQPGVSRKQKTFTVKRIKNLLINYLTRRGGNNRILRDGNIINLHEAPTNLQIAFKSIHVFHVAQLPRLITLNVTPVNRQYQRRD